MKFLLSGALAAAILASPVQAAPGQGQTAPTEIQGAVAYLMPLVLDGVASTCGPQLAPNGYVRTRLPALSAGYATERDGNWPAAKSAFLKLSNGRDQTLADLSDTTLRSLLDDMFGKGLKKEIKPSACPDIERVLEALSPLDSVQLTNLIATVADLALQGRAARAAAQKNSAQ